MQIEINRVGQDLPADYDALRRQAQTEGYTHLERLAAGWRTGDLRFNRPGEALLAARIDGVLVGLGGLTRDPTDEGAMRMRRFYVAASHRRHGVGRAIALALLAQVGASRMPVTVNAAPGSADFWESLGFVADQRDGHTHRLPPV